MKERKAYIFILTALLGFGCSHEIPGDKPVEDLSAPILLGALTMDGTTKGVDPLQALNIRNFGLSAVWNYEEGTRNNWYLSEQAIIKEEGENPWSITPTAYWPLTGDLTFFFYAPSSNGRTDIKFVESETGRPGITFSPSTTNITGQIDACMGPPVYHATKADGPIPVHFKHVLSQVLFSAQYSGTIPEGFYMLIDEIHLNNLIGKNTARYLTESPYYQWDETGMGDPDSCYTLERKLGHLNSTEIPHVTSSDTAQIYESPGRLYLIPQTIGAGSTVEVVYGFYSGSGGGRVLMAQFIKEVAIPEGTVLPAGKIVHFILNVDVGVSSPVTLTTAISGWNDSNNENTAVNLP